MTSLTNKDYYLNQYKDIMGAVTLPDDLICKYLFNASNMVRRYTFGNIDETKSIIDDVQMCTCAVAEKLYEADTFGSDHTGVASEKVGDLSTTYEKTSDEKKNLKAEAAELIRTYLEDTGLMYCGG